MTLFIIYTVAAVSFLLGSRMGGNIGSFLGGLLGFGSCLFVIEYIQTQRGWNGFIQRHRGVLLQFVFIVFGLIIGQHFDDNFWGKAAGLGCGIGGGIWITKQLGWSPDLVTDAISLRLNYLTVLRYVVTEGTNDASEEIQNKLTAVAKRIFLSIGYSNEADVNSFLQMTRDVSAENSAEIVSALSRDEQYALLCDALRIVYSHPPVTDYRRTQLRTLFGWMGLTDDWLLRTYDRALTVSPGSMSRWLDELGLKPGCTTNEIDTAFRKAAKQYHPDRLRNLPAHLVELARSKMVSLNTAHQGLRNVHVGTDTIYFRPQVGDKSFIAIDGQEIICLCWLCNQINRIPENAKLTSARCRDCFALLGSIS